MCTFCAAITSVLHTFYIKFLDKSDFREEKLIWSLKRCVFRLCIGPITTEFTTDRRHYLSFGHTKLLHFRLYISELTQNDLEWVVCLIIRMSGLGFDPGSSRQMAYVLPLYQTDSYLRWILAATIFYNYTSWSRINVLPDGRHEFKSPCYLQLRTPLTRWTRRVGHTSIGYWYTTPLHPSIYPIWLYIRGNVWLGIFILATWLYQFSCGSINIFAYQFLGSVILR